MARILRYGRQDQLPYHYPIGNRCSWFRPRSYWHEFYPLGVRLPGLLLAGLDRGLRLLTVPRTREPKRSDQVEEGPPGEEGEGRIGGS